ncbi:TOM1-like protein 5 isoform X2 [Andrographis paniculata]|uniref:TOM1-like protein 5 isoform X2 n=1 Tax=Andrographis paniculata TaxID=175694 RepID=UPI0021E9429B|nr:TOM1-like protein 5 isoform X2 [Andrographis paniculata]
MMSNCSRTNIAMASELVSSATSDKLTEVDWTKDIEICELVARDHGQAKDVIKAIKKRLGSKNVNTQLYAVTLLEMLMNNIGDPVHRQVIEAGILPILVKIVKKKSDHPVREKIFLLLDAAQTSVGGANGRFPQYYASYYELVKAGVQFPQRPNEIPRPHSTTNVNRNNPSDKETAPPETEKKSPQAAAKSVSDSSILHKAETALEVLRDVLNTVDAQGAKDEFTLDLVEQCSFQKQRVMHLAITSRDERTVSRAVELNEKLEVVLRRHDDLVAGRTMSTSNNIIHEEEEEEEAEQLFRRIRKGKACIRPEDEDNHIGLMGRPIPGEMIHRPLIRPLPVEPEPTRAPNMEARHETIGSLALGLNPEPNTGKPTVAIPPPPAKHVEREKFFQENKADGSTLNSHLRNLSLHSRNASSSRSGSTDFSD